MSHESVEIVPSILSADFGRLAAEVEAVRAAGIHKIQVDVMDGRFVPNISVGLPVVEALARDGGVALDVHLMIEEPGRWVDAFVGAGATVVTVHAEAERHLQRTLGRVRELGALAGAALNPGSPACMLEEVLADVDVVLVMTVNPGFGGQRFLPSTLAKVHRLRTWVHERGLTAAIQVDGGIGPGTARLAVEAGATQLVAGSAVFAGGVAVGDAIAALRAEVAAARPWSATGG